MLTIEKKLENCYQDLHQALRLKDWSFLSSHQQQVRQVINEALLQGAAVSENVMEWLDKLQELYSEIENSCKAGKIHLREQMSESREQQDVIESFIDKTSQKKG